MNELKPLKIVDDEKTIFSDCKYFIPLYQRAFAWTENEIHQLISDISDFTAKEYFLGSLIVNERENGLYEVIDGQQRLTALFLLLHYLGYQVAGESLVYECRIKSNYTLKHLKQLCGNAKSEQIDSDKVEETLKKGLETIAEKFLNSPADKETFKEKLKQVRLFRIEVPPRTDLNRYFEIMNVRGEQLEQHDIVKAMLMEPFGKDENSRNAFAKIWDACRDMTGYVQMHFSTKNNDRENLFGKDWSCLCCDNFIEKLTPNNNNTNSHGDKKDLTALEIIYGSPVEQAADGEDEDGKQVRFDSIIDFPYFLLHVLRVFTGDDADNSLITLDDKKLVKTFEEKMKECGEKIQFSIRFIQCLLKCRFLFDKFIIKREREYKADDKNGKWSLKEIHNNSGKAQPKITNFENSAEPSAHNVAENILMLQACLRVSDTSPKSMPWITLTLKWLHNHYPVDRPADLESEIENYVQGRIKEDFALLEKSKFALGVATPHLFLNYLDYLLWKDRDNARYRELHFDDFDFEFRNSVEHWYPQHPSGFDSWEQRDRFGNLCLLPREVNSKFSNANPIAKQGYNKIIEKGSLKLRLMCKSTTTDDAWKQENGDCAVHEQEMLNLLWHACDMPIIP